MVVSAAMTSRGRLPATVRMTGPTRAKLDCVIFSRYPDEEWATFFLFGFRHLGDRLLITVADLVEPNGGDLNPDVSHVQFLEPYTIRAALSAKSSGLCVGVVHSHPEGYHVRASWLDDDMDGYYSQYFSGFRKDDCYASLIFAKDPDGKIHFSGRGCVNSQCFVVDEVLTIDASRINRESTSAGRPPLKPFNARIGSIYGEEARRRLAESSVSIIGCGGSGSAAAHVLARAGVPEFVLVDYDRAEPSNLERLHGMVPGHTGRTPPPYKVEIVRDLIKGINPQASVTCVVGNIVQELARNEALRTDVLLSCSDTNHSRAAVSELAYRYLLPALDVGVLLDGIDGQVRAEVVQVTMYAPGLPCAYCRDLIDPWRIAVELMTKEERRQRAQQAREANERGDRAGGYWQDLPQLHSVGHLTTLAGSIISAYATGWLTGRFKSPVSFFQFDILARDLSPVSVEVDRKVGCACTEVIGYADQGAHRSLIGAPEHWPAAFVF